MIHEHQRDTFLFFFFLFPSPPGLQKVNGNIFIPIAQFSINMINTVDGSEIRLTS